MKHTEMEINIVKVNVLQHNCNVFLGALSHVWGGHSKKDVKLETCL